MPTLHTFFLQKAKINNRAQICSVKLLKVENLPSFSIIKSIEPIFTIEVFFDYYYFKAVFKYFSELKPRKIFKNRRLEFFSKSRACPAEESMKPHFGF